MLNRKLTSALVTFGAIASLGLATTAFAQTTPPTPNQGYSSWNEGRGGMMGKGMMNRPVAVGKVTAVSGNTLTIDARGAKSAPGSEAQIATVTYTVDATNAKIDKARVAGTISSIIVGDNIVVEGTLSGTNITATAIHDGPMMGRLGDRNKGPEGQNGGRGTGTSTPRISPIQGDGQPVVAGRMHSIKAFFSHMFGF